MDQRRKDKKRKWFRPLKQGFLIAFSAGCLAACGQTASYQNAKGSAAAVSYTHLDVYKRQGEKHKRACQIVRRRADHRGSS